MFRGDVEKHLDVDETTMNVKAISDSSWFENAQNVFVSKFMLPHGTSFHWFILIFSIKRTFTPGTPASFSDPLNA
jgi:hypothetical protein